MKLDPAKDFYYDNGMMVLTEHFLRRRGHCCNNGCRHCPYRSEKEEKTKKDTSESIEKQD